MKKLCVLLLLLFACGTVSYSQSIDTALVVKKVRQHLRFPYKNYEKLKPGVALIHIFRTQDSVFIQPLNNTELNFILIDKPYLLKNLQELPDSSFPVHANVAFSIHFQYNDHTKLHVPSKKEVKAVSRKLKTLKKRGQQVIQSPLVVTSYPPKIKTVISKHTEN